MFVQQTPNKDSVLWVSYYGLQVTDDGDLHGLCMSKNLHFLVLGKCLFIQGLINWLKKHRYFGIQYYWIKLY